MKATLMIAVAIIVAASASSQERKSVDEALAEHEYGRTMTALQAVAEQRRELIEAMRTQIDDLRDEDRDRAAEVAKLRRTVRELRSQLQRCEAASQDEPDPEPKDEVDKRAQEILDRFRR